MNAAREPLSDQLRRERLLDMEVRLGAVRRQAFAVLALAVLASGPWIGFELVIPIAVLLGCFALVNRRLRRSDRPEVWSAIGWALSPLFIAISCLVTDGAESPGLMWFALPVATLGARFEMRGVRIGVAYTIVLLLIVTVGFDTAAVLERPDRLIFPLGLVVAIAILTGATVQSEREHRRDAVVDPLTGLLNRTAFAQRLGELQLQADQGESAPLGFLVADIDHFKRVNDAHGHPVGDAVLKDVADAMRAQLREGDLVYRVGGEEFAIVLPGADLAETRAIADRLRRAVEDSDAAGVPVTMSVGAAVVAGADVRFPLVYAQADAALYAAKRAGRNRVALAPAA